MLKLTEELGDVLLTNGKDEEIEDYIKEYVKEK